MRDFSERRSAIGICQWFHFEDYEAVQRTRQILRELGIKHLRTGISWADYFRPKGREWYQWQMEALQEFELLISIWHTPPSIAEGGNCAGPPIPLDAYAAFLWQVIEQFSDYFKSLELWNEPNNRLKWNFLEFDPSWSKFGEMVRAAGEVAKECGMHTVLGGIIPVDPEWLKLMESYGALDSIDTIAIHGFPGMWWDNFPNWDWYQHWHGWTEKVEKIRSISGKREIWITETGLATWNLEQEHEDRLEEQGQRLIESLEAPVERVYWYSAIDLAPWREAIEGFHVDENEYHLGLVRDDGTVKPAFDVMKRLVKRLDNDNSVGVAP